MKTKMHISVFPLAALVLLLLTPGGSSAEDNSIPGTGPEISIPDPFPRTIIAAKSGAASSAALKAAPAGAGLNDRRIAAAAKKMLGAAGAVAVKSAPAGWLDELSLTYKTALADNKPMLVFFWDPQGEYSGKMNQVLNGVQGVDRLTECMVPARVNINLDDPSSNVKKMLSDLGYTSFPKLALLVAKTDNIFLIDEIDGYYSADETAGLLGKLIRTAISNSHVDSEIAAKLQSCRDLFDREQ